MIAISQQAAPALSARRSVATRSTLSTARPAQRAKLGLSVKAMMGGNDGDRKKLTRESEPKARGAEVSAHATSAGPRRGDAGCGAVGRCCRIGPR